MTAISRSFGSALWILTSRIPLLFYLEPPHQLLRQYLSSKMDGHYPFILQRGVIKRIRQACANCRYVLEFDAIVLWL